MNEEQLELEANRFASLYLTALGVDVNNYLPREHYISGFIAGYNISADMWIDVNDRLPEECVGVMVFIPNEDNHITAGMWDISHEWVLLDEYRFPESRVTHWMPMPPNPKGKKIKIKQH